MERAELISGEYTNRSVVPGECVRVISETARVTIPAGAGGEPHVELVRDGDIIRAIDVTCPCGKKIRLHCLYE